MINRIGADFRGITNVNPHPSRCGRMMWLLGGNEAVTSARTSRRARVRVLLHIVQMVTDFPWRHRLYLGLAPRPHDVSARWERGRNFRRDIITSEGNGTVLDDDISCAGRFVTKPTLQSKRASRVMWAARWERGSNVRINITTTEGGGGSRGR